MKWINLSEGIRHHRTNYVIRRMNHKGMRPLLPSKALTHNFLVMDVSHGVRVMAIVSPTSLSLSLPLAARA